MLPPLLQILFSPQVRWDISLFRALGAILLLFRAQSFTFDFWFSIIQLFTSMFI